MELETVPGKKATFSNTITEGVINSYVHEQIRPERGEEFRQNEEITFIFPRTSWIDPTQVFISFLTSIIPGENGYSASGVQFAQPNVENDFPYCDEYALSSYTEPGFSARAQFKPGIQCIFKRVRLYLGPDLLEDINDYHVLYRLLLEHQTTQEWRDGDGFAFEGYYDLKNGTQRMHNANFHSRKRSSKNAANVRQRGDNNDTTNPGHEYTIRPFLGLFDINKYLPLKYMNELRLVFTLNTNQECLLSTTTLRVQQDAVSNNDFYHALDDAPQIGPSLALPSDGTSGAGMNGYEAWVSSSVDVDYPKASYVVRNARLHLPMVTPDKDYDTAARQAIEANELSIHYVTFASLTKTMQNFSERFTANFPHRVKSLRGAIACFRNGNDINQIDTDIYFPGNGIQRYQWTLGKQRFPVNPVECSQGPGQALIELKRFNNKYGYGNQTSSTFTLEEFLPSDIPAQLSTFNASELWRGTSLPSSFAFALNLERAENQFSGFDSAASSVDIELSFELRAHKDLVGVTLAQNNDKAGDVYPHWRGALPQQLWQPSKRLTYMPYFSRRNPATNYDPVFNQNKVNTYINVPTNIWKNGTIRADTSNEAGTLPLFDRPSGAMLAQEVTRGYSASTAQYDPTKTTQSANGKIKQSSTIYLFTKQDQILRLTDLGRHSIVV